MYLCNIENRQKLLKYKTFPGVIRGSLVYATEMIKGGYDDVVTVPIYDDVSKEFLEITYTRHRVTFRFTDRRIESERKRGNHNYENMEFLSDSMYYKKLLTVFPRIEGRIKGLCIYYESFMVSDMPIGFFFLDNYQKWGTKELSWYFSVDV